MAGDDERLTELASAILDGTPIDWSAAESSVDGADRALLQHLKVIAALAGVHRMPASWSHLQLLERVGRGTFGEVFRAWDPRLDREVALKLLPAPHAGVDSPDSFIPEGRLLARVRHNNIVTIHGAEQIGDRIGLWMELVRGRTLDEMVAAGVVFGASQVAGIGRDLCSAVSAVHAAGLLHRDIKAHNVMVADDHRVVLMDFGTGRELEDSFTSDLAGTPLYVAPEVLDGNPATVQSDVYSLGVLLFHILSGKYPIEGQTLSDIRAAHANNLRSSLRTSRPDVPIQLARVIERAIDPVADRRFQSASALGAALRNATEGIARRRLIYGTVAATLVVAAGGLALRAPSGSTGGRIPAIAVLPFESYETGSESEEFVDGLTDEIQRSLAAIEGLALRSSGSSFAFKNKPRDLRNVAAQLGVDFVLEGSVSRVNNVLKIDTRFTRISDETVIWTEGFDRDLADLPATLDEISLAIVNKLRVKLGQGRRRYDLDPDVYYQFLRARAFHGRRGPQNSARSADLFQQVVLAAPDYAPAWAGLASSLAQLSRPSPAEDIIPPDPRIGPAALKALQLDPLLAEAHAAVANMYARDRDWVNARMSFLKALALNPTLTDTYSDFVLGVLMPLDDTNESLRQFAAARAVDPLSLDVRRTQAHVFIQAGRYDEAIENCLWIKRHDPAFPFVDMWHARALYLSRRFNEAEEVLMRAGLGTSGYAGYLLAVSGRRAEAEALIAEQPDSPSRTMLTYAGLGDKDGAYNALVRIAEINWWRAATWLHRPEMALLRGDPRMAELKKKLGLPH